MSYLDNSNSQNKTMAVPIVIGLHLFFGFAIIVGLNPKVQKVVSTIIEAKDVKEVEKPKDEPPPPPEKLEDIPPYVPPPVLDIALPPPPTQAPQITTQQEQPKPEPVRVVEQPKPEPAPRQIVKTVIDAKEFGKALSKKTRPDFPSSVIRQMESDNKTQSVVRGCRVYIGESGRVEKAECPNSEYPALAEKTQRWITGMKFSPATEDGKPVGSWVDQVPAVVWRLEE